MPAAQDNSHAAWQTAHDGCMQLQASATGSLHVYTADKIVIWILGCCVRFVVVTECSDSSDQQSHFKSCHYIIVLLLMVGLVLP